MKPLTRVPLILIAAAALAACSAAPGGGGTDPSPGGATDAPTDGPTDGGGGGVGVGPGISVEEAIESTLDGPLLVNGYLVASQDEVRLCSALAESYPPQCGGESLVVEGLDLETMPGLSSEAGVTWSDEEIQVLGSVEDGVLTVVAGAT